MTTSIQNLKIAILGAGPVGIEAALTAAEFGLNVTIFEKSPYIAANIWRWKHVQMFSPWALNTTPRGRSLLKEKGEEQPDFESMEAYPTGLEFVNHYLEPLGQHLRASSLLKLNTEVVEVGRCGLLKSQGVGYRHEYPGFILLINELGESRYETYDVVLDTTGCYGDVVPPGPSGLQPVGYSSVLEKMRVDIFDPACNDYRLQEGRVLVVGSGSSAATTLSHLVAYNARRREENLPTTAIVWYVNSHTPIPLIPDDPLPQRRRLSQFANEVASGAYPDVDVVVGGVICDIVESQEGFDVTRLDGHKDVGFSEIFLHTGFQPDHKMTRPLQIHYCYASEGPMSLAASLLTTLGAPPLDCLAQTTPGLETLKTSEPNFFILGSKSYARTPTFLLKIGYEQVQFVLESLR